MLMKTGIKILISLCFFTNTVFACNFNTDIKKQDGLYLYTVSCHKEVGKMYMDNKDLLKENEQLEKAYKNLKEDIRLSDKQMRLWRDETYEQHKRLMNVKNASDNEKWLWFGIGVLVMGGAVYGAGQLR